MIYGLRFSMILLALAVMIGAFGAHSIQCHLTPDEYSHYQTGVEYHFYHALGMIAIALIVQAGWLDPRRGKWIIRLLTLGILFFSGSLYLLSTKNWLGVEWLHYLWPITPIGGLCFVAAWVLAAFSVDLPVLRD